MAPHRLAQRRGLLRGAGLAGMLTGLGLIGGLSALTGCGFELRQVPPLPFDRIALTGLADRSPLGNALHEQLGQAVQVVASPAQAQVVLQVLADRREKGVVASTAAGQVRELQLRTRFEFRLLTPGGRELIPATELMLSRDMSYSETFALAKAQEEAGLYAAMQADIVQQVLRRLARATGAGLPAAAASKAGAGANSSANAGAGTGTGAAPVAAPVTTTPVTTPAAAPATGSATR